MSKIKASGWKHDRSHPAFVQLKRKRKPNTTTGFFKRTTARRKPTVVFLSYVTALMCDSVYESLFFSFPIMADLLLNPAYSLLFTHTLTHSQRESLAQWFMDTITTHTVNSALTQSLIYIDFNCFISAHFHK